MKEQIRKNRKQIAILVLFVIIIFAVFLYCSYRIETSKSLLYQDEITGQYLQDIGAKNICYIIVTCLCVYAFVIMVFLQNQYDRGKIKVETVFLLTVPFFCILVALAIPMSKGHDETIHGLRIGEYAEGKWISNGEKAYLEEGVINALDNKISYKEILENEKTYSTNTEEIEWGYRIASYSPVNYLPQWISVAMARVLTDNSLIHFYIARLANLISCMALLYLAIKTIPFGKNMLFLLSIIPITIEGFSTLSADGMLVSASFLWIAYILKLREEKEKKIEKKQIVYLSILAIIIALSKTLYIVLLPLLFMIPKEKFNSQKAKIGFIITICIICTILDFGWQMIGIQKETQVEEIVEEHNPVSIMISHPVAYMQKCAYTIIENLPRLLDEMFGGKLEWNEEITIPLFPTIFLLYSIIISIKGEKEIIWKKWEVLLIGGVILTSILLICTGMYVAWSPLYETTIQGIQGRYFIPIMPLVFLLLGRKFKEDSKTTRNIAIIEVTMQALVILEIVLFHI